MRHCSKCGTPQPSIITIDIFSCDVCGSNQFTIPTQGVHNPLHALSPALIKGAGPVTLGTPKQFSMRFTHKRQAFRPARLATNVPSYGMFILEKVEWGSFAEEQIICPFDLAEFTPDRLGVQLELARLNAEEAIVMKVLYSGILPKGFRKGNQFDLLIIWAEPGASLLRSEDITQTYSVE